MKKTLTDYYDELIRLLNIYFYEKADENEKLFILIEVKSCLKCIASLKEIKTQQAEVRRADREAKKLGIRH